MADNRSIVITLKLDQGENNNDINNQTTSSVSSQSNDNDASAKTVALMLAKQSISIVGNELIAWGEYYWNKELSVTDDYIAQRNKAIATTHINRVTSYANTVFSTGMTGFQLGSAFGPIGSAIGAAIGASIGLITSGLQVARSNAQGRDQQNLQLLTLQAQLDFTRSRAGWSLKAASIGEDL